MVQHGLGVVQKTEVSCFQIWYLMSNSIPAVYMHRDSEMHCLLTVNYLLSAVIRKINSEIIQRMYHHNVLCQGEIRI